MRKAWGAAALGLTLAALAFAPALSQSVQMAEPRQTAEPPQKIVLAALGESWTRSTGATSGCLGGLLVGQPALMDWLNLYQQVTGNVGFSGRGAPCGGKGWVDRLATMFQADGPVDVVNASSAGATLDIIENYETNSVPTDATTVVIFAGTSDEKRIITGKEEAAKFIDGFPEVIQVLRTKVPHARIFVAMLPDLSKLPVMPAGTGPNPVTAANPQNVADGTVKRYLQLHAHLNDVIQRLGVVVVNPYCAPALYGAVSSDGFHPNNDGHLIIAEHFFAAAHGAPEKCI